VLRDRPRTEHYRPARHCIRSAHDVPFFASQTLL
jgi:hypothetical protein